ncbi:MAG: sulfatase-like hydrolase/transferase [Bacteroidota bacterium]
MPRLLALLVSLTVAASAQEQPNVVLIMSDDQGYGDAGYLGHPVLQTPHLDAMAAAGTELTRFYTHPTCAPSRMSVLTGRHPARSGVWAARYRGNYRPAEVTLAEILGARGYRTGLFGKWHLGRPLQDAGDGAPEAGAPDRAAPWTSPDLGSHTVAPWADGFDTAFTAFSVVPTFDPLVTPPYPDRRYLGDRRPGEPYGVPYYRKRPGTPVETLTDGLPGVNAAHIVDAADSFIREAVAEGAPFLAVVWFHAPHRPVVAGPRHRALYGRLSEDDQHWYGAITAMDEQIGRLRALLREVGVAEQTVVWFQSDNGPSRCSGIRCAGTTGGLRGRKGSVWEGGIRVPGLVEWPGRLGEGTVSRVPVTTSDLLPTTLSLLGLTAADVPEVAGVALDGIDVWPILTGAQRARAAPIAFRHYEAWAVVDDDWKLVRPDDGPPRLYDLARDPGERHDRSAERPEIAARLLAWFEGWERSWRSDFFAAARP